ncbi:unnamed protein product [Schistosoma margrebowiei]|uniref:Uncharacterized protein n=1 Tax=Schistosoma margrebowiei TaxID=48269 RepID=A0A183MLN3_9TREM|nr:unnamed protein product [Schistosoma margrebowiei]
MKTNSVTIASGSEGLNISKEKSKTLKYNREKTNKIKIDKGGLEDVDTFIYLASIIDEQKECDADVEVRIGKTRSKFLQLKNIWNSK